ncbi:hypothetical protein AAMO2058_000775000 [Amorphochlora amoebiformis]
MAAEQCLQSLHSISEMLRHTTDTFEYSLKMSQYAMHHTDFRKEGFLVAEEELQELAAKKSRVAKERIQKTMESLKSDLRVKQEKEHSLMLDLEKLHREIKSQAAKQIALVEPELKQQAQHINRRKVLLTSALEKLKADMQKGAESASGKTTEKLLLAKRKTQQMKQTLKEVRYDLQQECMKVRQLEEKEKDTEQKLEYVLEDEEMDPEEILENKNRHEEQQMHKLELIGEIERMRVVMEGLKLRRKEMERSRARKESQLKKMQSSLKAEMSRASVSIQHKDTTIDPKSLAGFTRVLFPAQLSGAISEIMTMLIESSKKTADGFRLISKENIVTKLDSTWTTHDEGERERLTMKAIGEMAARQMIAQDGDHVWEVRS